SGKRPGGEKGGIRGAPGLLKKKKNGTTLPGFPHAYPLCPARHTTLLISRTQSRRRRADSFFFFQAEDGIRDWSVTGVQTCALPISVFGLRVHHAEDGVGVGFS